MYTCLRKNIFEKNGFKIIPIRLEDKYTIMDIRNEQLFHLRQNEPLTKEKQDVYFDQIVSKLFDQEYPNQLLFSFFENETFIGYGGLVHINWKDQNAEISFVMKTALEKDSFDKYWLAFLSLIEELAFQEIKFHKIFTFAFDVRPALYPMLKKAGFTLEAVLKEHALIDGVRKDVLIHSKFNSSIDRSLVLLSADMQQVDLYFEWTNDPQVRLNSLNKQAVVYEDHVKWFTSKLQSNQAKMYVLFQDKVPVGQIRLEKEGELWNINYSIDKKFRGQGFGVQIIDLILKKHRDLSFMARVEKGNVASLKIFQKLNFQEKMSNHPSEIVIFEYHSNARNV